SEFSASLCSDISLGISLLSSGSFRMLYYAISCSSLQLPEIQGEPNQQYSLILHRYLVQKYLL
ncbi:hypothetical protein, partial [Dehalobacter sp. UNSWDHB]|uniref:hypothetical protein n=1 Tax=Dehalobacter sp. UNSWDHB TaxID=1339256 RepID=UPI001A99A4BE